MENDQKKVVDLYIPRRCFATNRILDAKDHASVQITLSTAGLKEFEDKTKEDKITMILSGFVRKKGNADAALNKFLKSKGVLSFC
ncbi:MAG: 40S ribosomal protein S21 [archaeon]|nr:40S ribosomal protein S21 [archaeon]